MAVFSFGFEPVWRYKKLDAHQDHQESGGVLIDSYSGGSLTDTLLQEELQCFANDIHLSDVHSDFHFMEAWYFLLAKDKNGSGDP
jgi:hypothetical protein